MATQIGIIDGSVCIGAEEVTTNRLGVLRAGSRAELVARTASQLVLLGGPPLDGPR